MITLTGVLNDLHIPFGDDRAINLVLDAFQDLKIDRLVLNGDVLDFYNLSMHGPKHPDVQALLENEIDAGREFFNSLRKRFPTQEIVMQSGNHEVRLDRFIINNAPPFWNLYTIEKMLQLKELGIVYYPYNTRVQLENTNLYIQHSPPSYTSAKQAYASKHDQSSIYGCSHRAERYTRTGASGTVYETLFNGCLVNVNLNDQTRTVFGYAKGHENWQQCATLVAVEDGVNFHIEQSIIRDYKIKLGGAIYAG